ncbi:MAG TPA: ATP-binding protein [Marmoricola sp.]|jgi:signal transduction histidine kinase|nr:ATP-binding protein [Marmoricola sp.]
MPEEAVRHDSVRRLMSRLVGSNILVLLLLALVGVLAVWRSTESVRYVTERLQPVASANAAVVQHLTTAESHVRAWGLSGDPAEVRQYHRALAEQAEDQRLLHLSQTGDARLAELIDDQKAAVEQWVEQYAEVRLGGRPGLSNADPAVLQRGLDLIRTVRADNQDVAERIDVLAAEARDEADTRLRGTLVALALVALGGLIAALLVARRVGRRVVDPLVDLEHAVIRMTDGDRQARATVAGPSEVVRVASALNVLAEENERARQVEHAIIEQLRALDSVKSDFVSNVSHELRTPLTSISGYVEILEEELGDRLTDDEVEMIDAAKRNVSRLSDLIEDLLTLSRAESRGTDLKTVDLVPLLTDVVNDVAVSASQRGVQVLLTRPDAPVLVLGDASQVSRAVTNLLTNAVKYSHGAPEVQVCLEVDGTDALVEVRDRGIGIPASEMVDLGSRFYRATNAVDLGISGTGLGLRIVQAILENHHGSLEIESEHGRGTTARMRLPLQAFMQPVAGSPAAARSGNKPRP